jgi:hypothetical protein
VSCELPVFRSAADRLRDSHNSPAAQDQVHVIGAGLATRAKQEGTDERWDSAVSPKRDSRGRPEVVEPMRGA